MIRGRLVSIIPSPSPALRTASPVAFRFVPMTWFERTFLNVRSIFDTIHRRDEGLLVQLRNVSHPPQSRDLLVSAPKVTWLESFVFQKPYVVCTLISRRINGKGGGGEEMAVVDVSWRPYMQWKVSNEKISPLPFPLSSLTLTFTKPSTQTLLNSTPNAAHRSCNLLNKVRESRLRG